MRPSSKDNALVCVAILVLVAFGAGKAAAQPFEAGVHYQELSSAPPTNSAEEVEVAEVFRYDCPGCYRFEPHVQQWKASIPDYVNFVQIPAVFNDLQRMHARAFYTAEALGKLDEMHGEFFAEIHERRNLLESEAALEEFFGRFGVDREAFSATFDSFAVHTKVQQATDAVRRYRIPETPAVVVNRKYLSLGGMAGGYGTWFDIIDYLAAAEYGDGE